MEGLRHPVRLPRSGSAVVAEHEPVGRGAGTLGVIGEHGERARIEVDDMTSFGLRGGEHRAVWSFDPAGTERNSIRVEVDVVPSQPEKLCAAGTGDRGEIEEDVQSRVAVADMFEQLRQLF
jgi:hypothetical protein